MGKRPYSVIFWGTPEDVIPVLRALMTSDDFSVLSVITRPDAPRGRGLKIFPSPVKEYAVENGLNVLTPAKTGDDNFIKALKDMNPDVGVCVSYGKIISRDAIEAHSKGIVNVHPSLLPRWRGAAPVQRAIENGDETTGVTFMLITEGLDEGPILFQESTEIFPDEMSSQLMKRLMHMASVKIVDVLLRYLSGEIAPREQKGEPTYAEKVNKKEGLIRWDEPAKKIYNRFRAFYPWPGIYTQYRGRNVIIHRCSVDEGGGDVEPGTVVAVKDYIWVKTGDGLLKITELQVAGKKRVTSGEFIRGYRIKEGDKMG